jgi:hypothetical protein
VRRSPIWPTEMLRTSFCTLISRIGFDCFFFSDSCWRTRVSLTKKIQKRKEEGFGHEDTMGAIPWKETAGSLLLLLGWRRRQRQRRGEMGVERGGWRREVKCEGLSWACLAAFVELRPYWLFFCWACLKQATLLGRRKQQAGSPPSSSSSCSLQQLATSKQCRRIAGQISFGRWPAAGFA